MPEDYSQLVEKTETTPPEKTDPPSAPAAEPEPVVEIKTTTEEPKAPPVAKEEPEDRFSVPVQKLQQKQRALEDTIKRQSDALEQQAELLRKIAEANGVEVPKVEAKPVAQDDSANEVNRELASIRRELEFGKVLQKNPNANPGQMWEESFSEAFETLGIPADAEELPEGITSQAVQRVANAAWERRKAALGAAPQAVPVPSPTPTRKPAPPVTAGGARVTSTASHVPVVRTPRDSFLDDCRKLTGQEN